MPWHVGAIRYFKEAGVWTDEHQKNNDQLMRRQDLLAEAWAKAKAGQFANDAEFRTEWRKARGAALTSAGLEP